MMSAMDSPLHERVYRGIKMDYLAGYFVPGRRIDLQNLADRHRSSKTPVREAAFIMVGEGLLTHHSDGGFMVPILEPLDLIELLAWHMQLVQAAASALTEMTLHRTLQQYSAANVAPLSVDVATRAMDIFTSIADATGNRLVSTEIRRLNERLHYSRISEPLDPPSAERELRNLTRATDTNLRKAVRRRIEVYHARKIDRQRRVMQKASFG